MANRPMARTPLGNPELDEVLDALRGLYEETQDWQDALGDERPSLVEARARAAEILGIGNATE